MRAAGRPLLDDGEDLAGVDGHAQLGQARRDAMHAGDALGALRAQEVLEPGGLVVHAVAEDVDLRPRHVAVDLEAGDDGHPRGAAALCASASPSVLSWSVMASTRTPCRHASSTSARGDRAPSEAVVCVWRSTGPGHTYRPMSPR